MRFEAFNRQMGLWDQYIPSFAFFASFGGQSPISFLMALATKDDR
jgi:hypothetical protein